MKNLLHVNRAIARAALVCSILVIAACNSGKGGGPSAQPPPPAYTIGGTVSGLAGNSVALRLNGGADLVVAANGNFTFPGNLASGAAYAVTVQTQPTGPAQTCTLANATGSVATASVTNITVACVTTTYRVRGTLSGLAQGSVVLRNNGGDDLSLAANGAFVFATAVPDGGAFAVTVRTQPIGPSQTCVVTQGSGTVAAADVTTVAVDCSTNSFTIGGTVAGLTASGLVLRNNGGDDLAVTSNGPFTFSASVPSGGGYAVSVLTDPPMQRCAVTNGSGIVGAVNVGGVTVTCVPLHTIGGTVRGLDVGGLVLRNAGGDDLTVSGNGAFTFATPVALGAAYDVTAVAGTPASPRHVCQVARGSGTVAGNVSDVLVTCEADRFAYIAHNSIVSFDGPGLISALVMNHETGALEPIAGTSTFPLDNGAVQILSDPRGRFVYVAHTAVYTQAGSVSGFAVNPATGALTPVPGSTVVSGVATNGLAIDSEGRFLFAANRYSNDVSVWAINADGSLTPAPGSPRYIGDNTNPAGVATSVAGQCCHLYVGHSNQNGVPQVSAFSYDANTGALTQLPSSPVSAGLSAYTPAALLMNNAGDTLYMANSGTSNISTFDVASGTGALTQRAGSPSPGRNANCALVQPRLSESLLIVSSLSYELSLFGEDPATRLPAWQDSESMFAGSYCSVGTDPYGKFFYVPKFDDIADYLFGFQLGPDGQSLVPLALNPLPPENTYTLTAIHPRAMVIRNSRRDREVLQLD